MNVQAKSNPPDSGWPAHSVSEVGWSWKKTGIVIALVFAAYLAFLFIFAAKKPPAPRTPDRVSQFEIVANDSIVFALDDPTLFVVPHVQDFVPSVWRELPEIVLPPTTLIEPSPFLLPPTKTLGAKFAEFMATNRFANTPFALKPEPRFVAPIVPAISMLPTNSILEVTGDLANRPRIGSVHLPTLSYNDVIAPSRVQVLVDAAGNVISAVLLPSESALENAGRANIGDTNALNIARGLHFTPASGLTRGELIFNWFTTPEPVTTTNTPTVAP